MTPGTTFLFDLTAQVEAPGSLAPRCGARFFFAFSGNTARVSSISCSVFSLVIPFMGFLSAIQISPVNILEANFPSAGLSTFMGKYKIHPDNYGAV
jgi:hypothetical protein